VRDHGDAPTVPDDVSWRELDSEVRQEMRSLPKTLAERVGGHLVMAGRLLDVDAELAYQHARAAARLAARVGAVREAAGLAAYATGRYAEALTELRAVRRMTGSDAYWAVMADCERGLGRPERALAMAREPQVVKLDRATQVELRIVAAGARADLGQHEAAVVTLQGPELAMRPAKAWSPRLWYAYAEALLAVGREPEARDWFAKAAEADENGATDAAERLAELDGVEFLDALDGEAGEADAANPDAANPADVKPDVTEG
jgi:tetratricopeptide (TPR) repeat protein